MGQKVHPNIIRLGIIRLWNSVWYANKKEFASNLRSDFEIRRFLYKKLSKAYVSKMMIERLSKNIRIIIYTARPGIIIGRKGEDIDNLRKMLVNITHTPVKISISEIRKPELDAKLVADNISSQLERRLVFRRVIKKAVQNAIRLGAKGAKVEISGRLGGAEIARTEWYREGCVPLHTFRADIDYSISKAVTNYGIIGVKVWIYKGEVLDNLFFNSEIYKDYFFKNKK